MEKAFKVNKTTLLAIVLLFIIGGLGYFMFQAKEAAPDGPAVSSMAQASLEVQSADDFNDQHSGHNHTKVSHTHADGVTHDHSHDDNIEDDHYHDPHPLTPAPSFFADLQKANPIDVPAILGTRAIGNPNAPLKITELFSLTCGHCATFHNDTYPGIKKNFVDTGKVYYVYQEFPLNAPALHASMIARCLPQERYEGFISLLFKTQDQWAATQNYKDALRQNAKLAGLSDQEFDACLENKELQQAFANVISQASQNWQIKSTPTIVFNDGEKTVAGAQAYPAMEHAINQFLARAEGLKAIKAPKDAMHNNAAKAMDAVTKEVQQEAKKEMAPVVDQVQ